MVWYNDSWLRRKAITLTGNTSGAQTDYQMKLTVTYDSDMTSDFSDLRFTKLDGTTLLESWLESYTASTSAIIWVKTDTPANGVNADIYMYYKNSAASSDWDIENTFLLGDDFSGASVDWTDRWVSDEHTDYSISSDKLRAAVTTNTDVLNSQSSFTAPIVIESSMRCDNTAGNTVLAFEEYAAYLSGYDHVMLKWNDDRYQSNLNSSYNALATTENLSLYYRVNYTIPSTGDATFEILKSGSSAYSRSGTPHYRTGKLALQHYGSGYGWYDWIMIRKYCSNPATYVFGSEEFCGWLGTIMGINKPAKIMGIARANIANVTGI